MWMDPHDNILHCDRLNVTILSMCLHKGNSIDAFAVVMTCGSNHE